MLFPLSVAQRRFHLPLLCVCLYMNARVDCRADDPNTAAVALTVTEFKRLERHLCEDSAERETLATLTDTISLFLRLPAEPGSVRGCFLLLKVIAAALRKVCSEERNKINWAVMSRWDTAGLVRACAVQTLQDVALSVPCLSLETTVGDFYMSRCATGEADAAVVGTSSDQDGGQKRGGEHLSTGSGTVTELCAPLLRCVVSITASLLLLSRRHPTTELLDVAQVRVFTPQYLMWLALPEYDIRADLAAILAWTCSPAGASGGDAACRDHFTHLSRQLQHKLSAITQMTSSAGPRATRADRQALRSAAGAVRAAGAIVALLDDAVELDQEQQALRRSVLDHCSLCLGVAPAPPVNSTEVCVLQVVSMEVVQSLAGRCSNEEASSVIALLKPLLQSADVRISVPAIDCFGYLCCQPGR